MTTSQNGWTANDRSVIATRTVRGTHVRVALRVGAPGDLLLEIVALFDLMVQDVDQGADDWGYAERAIRGTSGASSETISNHASGTAVDINATRWPLGSNPSVNLTPRQIATVREIVAATNGVVRWGGDYTGRKDPMHFEITGGQTELTCARALARLRALYGNPNHLEDNDVISPELEQMIRETHSEVTKRLPNRRGPQGKEIPNGGDDTVLGYSANADGASFRASWTLDEIQGRLEDIVSLIAQHANASSAGALDYDALAAALLRQMANPTH